jgi:hypothetical protein
MLQTLTQHRILTAIGAVGLFILGWFPVADSIRIAGSLGGLLGTLIALLILMCSALAARLTPSLILESILGVLIITAAGALLDANVMEFQFSPLYRVASIVAILLAARAYALLRSPDLKRVQHSRPIRDRISGSLVRLHFKSQISNLSTLQRHRRATI